MTALDSQAAVTDWPMRLLLTAATAAVILLVLAALRRGWRRRGQRQDWAPLPAVPALDGTSAPVAGKYVGTVRAEDWLDRIVAGGTMARAQVAVARQGVLVDRQGDRQLFLPAADITDVDTAPGMVTKVFGRHGILAITWRWGGADVVSGIWFADAAEQSVVRAEVERLIGAGGGPGGAVAARDDREGSE